MEFSLPMVAQAQVNLAQEFTYPRALRSLMRQDPQVIMVGEIRDPETAAIAVQAGLTGHLVISTIHSGSTAGVFARLMNMDIEPFLLASSVTGVLGLRLLRKNCTYCAQPYEPEPAFLKLVPLEERESAEFRRGGGCEQCLDTGFRRARFRWRDCSRSTSPFGTRCWTRLPTRALQQVAVDHGMQTMWQRGLRRRLTAKPRWRKSCASSPWTSCSRAHRRPGHFDRPQLRPHFVALGREPSLPAPPPRRRPNLPARPDLPQAAQGLRRRNQRLPAQLVPCKNIPARSKSFSASPPPTTLCASSCASCWRNFPTRTRA